jgi:hypothetical protein
VFGHADWSHRGDYIVEKHGVTPDEADEALGDPERIVIDPDYNSTSGRSVRIIGFSQTAGTCSPSLSLRTKAWRTA